MWIGDEKINEGYDYMSTAYLTSTPLAITNSAYCVDKKDAGYDLEFDRSPSVLLKL